MKIEITQVTPWSRVLDAARWTMGKDGNGNEPTDKFKRGILMAQHSPIRLLEFDIKIKGIPYCNAVHFVRHHIGVEKFQCTLRDDRNKEIDDRRKLPQNTPVNLWLYANADALISISRKRLCSCADRTTRYIWTQVRNEMEKVEPNVARVMVQECVYRGFCPELNSCGYADTGNYDMEVMEYRESH